MGDSGLYNLLVLRYAHYMETVKWTKRVVFIMAVLSGIIKFAEVIREVLSEVFDPETGSNNAEK